MEPRSVMLVKEKTKKTTKTKKEKKREEEKEKKETLATEPFHGSLLQAIASFLDRHGFSKTHSAFSSEARIEVDSLAADSLEAIYSKYAKDRREISNGGGPYVLMEKDPQTGLDTSKDEFIASEETHKKKRKRGSHDENIISNSNIPMVDSGKAPSVGDSSEPNEKKKKSKPLANGCTFEDVEQNEGKLKSGAVENSGLVNKVEKVGSADVQKPLEQSIEEPKHKKKKKNKSSASQEEVALQGHGEVPQAKVDDSANYKKTESVSNGSSGNESGHDKDRKKKRKKEAPQALTSVESEHTCILNSQPNTSNKMADGGDIVKEEKHDLLKNENAEHKKSKKKKEKTKPVVAERKLSLEGSEGDEKLDKTANIPVEKLTGGSKNGSGRNEAEGLLKLKKLNDNGIDEDKGHVGDSITKTATKDSKHSAEPKTVNAFRRVNPDEVSFSDERLQDNSYWAKGGADTGYGAKAQEILGQVRGKDFRHEKTKKKRGTYRGGQIDFHSHSIKFNYSDEE